MSSKTEIGPWDNWFTTKWGVYPFIEKNKKNIDKRVIVLYKMCYKITYSIKEMALC